MKNRFVLSCMLFFFALCAGAKKVELYSPDKEIKLVLDISDRIRYDVFCKNQLLLRDNSMQLVLGDKVLGKNPRLRRQRIRSVDEQIMPVVPFKQSSVRNHYNELTLEFGRYAVMVRAFDDGFAYRFVTSEKDSIEVRGEEFSVNFPDDYLLHTQQPEKWRLRFEYSEDGRLYCPHKWKKEFPVALFCRGSVGCPVSREYNDLPFVWYFGNRGYSLD